MIKINKNSKFNYTFDEPICFCENNEWVISGELYTKEEAFRLFDEEFKSWGNHTDGGSRFYPYSIDDVKENRVKFCCQYDYDEGKGRNAWWLESKGKGSKPVWVLQVSQRPKVEL